MSIPIRTTGDLDKIKLRNWLVGAGLLGGGAATVTSLINHFNTLNSRAERAKDTAGDDDVLYVNLQRNGAKAATVSGTAATLAAAAPVGLGAFALVRSLYEKMKRQELQKEMDEAQNAYLDTMAPAEKTASGPIGFGEAAMSMPAVLWLLTAAGSGMLSSKILDKNFPAPKAPSALRPRRLVVRDRPPVEEEEEVAKVASAEDHDDAAEGLLRCVLALPGVGEASGLGDLVKAAAQGRTEEILAVATPEALFALPTVKSAATITELQRDMAIGWLVREPELAPVVKLAAALEFQEACPLACALGRSGDEYLIKLAAEFCRLHRAQRYATLVPADGEKRAELDLVAGLRTALEASQPAPEDREVNIITPPSEDSTGKKVQVRAEGATARKAVGAHKDEIDSILSPANGQSA